MNPTWLDKLRRFLPQAGPVGHYPPLLDTAEREQLQAYALQTGHSLLQFGHSVAHQRLGDRLSRFRGQGFEFEENRRYQQGDPQRLINWRLYARRGELFTKQFIEERRPEACLLVDRRAGMRFGTRGRLKAALAAQLATVTILQASRQLIPVGGVVLDDTARWYDPALGQTGIMPLLETISAPCPPQAFDREQESLQQVLAELDMRLNDGCFILLLSDFSDLDTNTAAPVLQRLGERHTVQAIRIQDVAETQLPAISPLLIEDPDSEQALVIEDSRDYQSAVAQRQSELHESFGRTGIALHDCDTRNDWLNCLQQAMQEALPYG